MNEIRKMILERIDSPGQNGEYDLLKSMIISTDPDHEDKIDEWFSGVIGSLFFRPNRSGLILMGEHFDFMRSWFPDWMDADFDRSCVNETYNRMYSSLAVCIENVNITKDVYKFTQSDYFTIDSDMSVNKRLSSFCGTSRYPKQDRFKRIHFIDVDFIDLKDFNKEKLWQDIFAKFKK